jgi:hypothetical protein
VWKGAEARGSEMAYQENQEVIYFESVKGSSSNRRKRDAIYLGPSKTGKIKVRIAVKRPEGLQERVVDPIWIEPKPHYVDKT